VDALVQLPGADNVILTGSSDGMIRALQIYPNKLLGLIADHGEFPIERLKICREGRWLGSASHDEILKLTDVKDCLEDSDDEDKKEEEAGDEKADSDSDEEEQVSSEEEVKVEKKKRKKKRDKDPLGIKKQKGSKEDSGNANFFADL
jgi:WD repeat-containing protein 55